MPVQLLELQCNAKVEKGSVGRKVVVCLRKVGAIGGQVSPIYFGEVSNKTLTSVRMKNYKTLCTLSRKSVL